MSGERMNRHARRSQGRSMPRDRRLHYHVGDSIFATHQEARQYAAIVAAELRGDNTADGVVLYVTTIRNAIDAQLRVVSCDQDCLL